MDSSELESLDLKFAKKGLVKLQRGKGCAKCRGTGYLGRTGIFEVLPITETLKELIIQEVDQESLRTRAKKEGMVTMRENAIRKLLDGATTYQEVLRVTWEQL